MARTNLRWPSTHPQISAIVPPLKFVSNLAAAFRPPAFVLHPHPCRWRSLPVFQTLSSSWKPPPTAHLLRFCVLFPPLASLSFYLSLHSHLSDFDTCPTFHALIFCVSRTNAAPRNSIEEYFLTKLFTFQ